MHSLWVDLWEEGDSGSVKLGGNSHWWGGRLNQSPDELSMPRFITQPGARGRWAHSRRAGQAVTSLENSRALNHNPWPHCSLSLILNINLGEEIKDFLFWWFFSPSVVEYFSEYKHVAGLVLATGVEHLPSTLVRSLASFICECVYWCACVYIHICECVCTCL